MFLLVSTMHCERRSALDGPPKVDHDTKMEVVNVRWEDPTSYAPNVKAWWF
jgi:hypothetical protein